MITLAASYIIALIISIAVIWAGGILLAWAIVAGGEKIHRVRRANARSYQ